MTDRLSADDRLATILLCTRLGLSRGAAEKPLETREWNRLVRAMLATGMARPADLLGRSATELREMLDLAELGGAEPAAERIATLLQRGVAVASELQRLADVGVWVVARSDDAYPSRLRARLGDTRPPVFFGAGPRSLLDTGGVAVVGSRDVAEAGQRFAAAVGQAAGRHGETIVSGGARGVDRLAMEGAVAVGGAAVGILADSLVKWLRDAALRRAIVDESLVLATTLKPDAGFDVGNAMARNRLIHTLADRAVVVASDLGKGGTWAGATENLKHGWVPLFVRSEPDAPAGNAELLRRGAVPVHDADLDDAGDLFDRLDARAAEREADPAAPGGPPTQPKLL